MQGLRKRIRCLRERNRPHCCVGSWLHILYTPVRSHEGEQKGGEIKETITLPDGLLESQPWPITVTLIGDHRMEINSMNRSGGRTGTKDYDSADKQQLISLTEFEKRMGKKHFAEILGKFVMKHPGKLALVPESDPRPPVDLTSTCDQEFLRLFSRALFLWR